MSLQSLCQSVFADSIVSDEAYSEPMTKKCILSLYNMHSSGSLAILLSIASYIPTRFTTSVVLLPSIPSVRRAATGIPHPIFINIPKSKLARKIQSIFIDQACIPVLAVLIKANAIYNFGNVASILSRCQQKVFFHNALYILSKRQLREVNSSASLQGLYVRLSLLLAKPTIFVQNKYMQEALQSSLYLTRPKVFVIGSPFPCKNSIQAGTNGTISYNYPEIKRLKLASKYIFIYPSFPYSYKDHAFLISLNNYFQSRSIHVIFTCSRESLNKKTLDALPATSHSFSFVGNLDTDELKNFYVFSDVVIFTSRVESLGMPIIEASLYNKPLLVPSLPYATTSVTNAYFYDPSPILTDNSSPSSFSIVCDQLISDLNEGRANVARPIINTDPTVFLDLMRANA